MSLQQDDRNAQKARSTMTQMCNSLDADRDAIAQRRTDYGPAQFEYGGQDEDRGDGSRDEWDGSA